MKHNLPVAALLIFFSLFSLCEAQITIFDHVRLFPDTQFVPTFPADGNAHQMRIETIEFTRTMRASMGTLFPLLEFDLFGITAQAGIGASVHFEVRPMGQAHIVSDEYYIDYLILDLPIVQHYFIRFAGGHTSHHLSDNWYERLQLSTAFHYARDYVKLFGVYSDQNGFLLYAGANYGYIVTIKQRVAKPWNFQAGGEAEIVKIFDVLYLFYAFDGKIKQEAGFAATMTHQLGAKFSARNTRNLRIAFQYRHGLDERGQFFPQHRTVSTFGIYFDM
ncbi:MAG: DUF1207 domain-containing protein [Ignavibacteriales bacterium]|nr:DUF1207 domain-containing protein [Ignavibacteriales bacterium]